MTTFTRYSVLSSVLLLFTGCAGLNSKFDCPMKPGVMCQSIDQANAQVDAGTLGGSHAATGGKSGGQRQALATVGSKSPQGFHSPYPVVALNPGDPIRYGESVLRVWLAPYEDKEGNYYQPSVFYTVVKGGHWIGEPVKAINDDGEEG